MRPFYTVFCLAASVALFSGCNSTPPPPIDYLGTNFSKRPKGEADEILKSISVLSLEDAQKIAIANNPSYTAAYYSINAARMRYYQALGAYSPVLSAGFDLSQGNAWTTHRNNTTAADETRSFNTGTAVRANWLLFDGLSREFAVKIAEHSLSDQQLMTEDECRLLIRAVAFAYNDVLLAIEKMRIATEDMAFQEKNLSDTEIKLAAGAVAKSNKLNFQILSNVAAGDKIVAEYQYQTALYALAALMGYPEGTLPPHITFPQIKSEFVDDLPSVDIYLDSALSNRPDLRAYREELKVAEYQLYQTYSAFSPTLSGFAEFSYDTTRSTSWYSDSPHMNSGYNRPGFAYGLSANWTIFNGFIRYNVSREYQARLSVAQYQVADMWLKVVQEVRGAYNNYIQSAKQARLYEKTLEYTTEQRGLVEDEYRLGSAELTRLNEAQRDLTNAQTTLASAYINLQNALSQLEAAASMNAADYGQAPKPFSLVAPTVESVDPAVVGTAEKEADAEAAKADTATAPAAAPTAGLSAEEQKLLEAAQRAADKSKREAAAPSKTE
jgi:outer membrane protein TolC